MGVDTPCSGSKTPQSIAFFLALVGTRRPGIALWNLSGMEHHPVAGEAMLVRVLHELLIMSCMLAFVTGIVIAGARLLG